MLCSKYVQRQLFWIKCIGILLIGGSGSLLANAATQSLRIDGGIFDSSGVPLTGNRDVRIDAYDAASGGSLLWQSAVSNVSVSSGRFSLILDASSGSPSLVSRLSSLADGSGIYFEIVYDTGTADGSMDTPVSVTPRIRSKGSVFALASEVADSLSGVTATAAELNYLAGSTANLQTQLNAKLDKGGDSMSGHLTLLNQQELRLGEGSGSNYLALRALATLGASYTLTLPADDGDSGEYLKTDGSGNLTWDTPAGGGGSGDKGGEHRNQVLTGEGGVNGFTYLAAVGGQRDISINASSTEPLIVSFAASFDGSNNPVDYIESLTSDQTSAWDDITASTTHYLYIDRNTGTGALTYGSSEGLAPIYSYAEPGSPSTGQHWFDLSLYQMKSYNGASWDTHHRVFVGVAVTNGSSVTSLVTYRTASDMAIASGGMTSCPTGFSRVGEFGRKGSFCITQAEQAANSWFGASAACSAMTTSTGDIPRLCSASQWYSACNNGVDAGETALANMTDDPEWIDDAGGYNAGDAPQFGNGSCSTVGSMAMSSAGGAVYRCCVQ